MTHGRGVAVLAAMSIPLISAPAAEALAGDEPASTNTDGTVAEQVEKALPKTDDGAFKISDLALYMTLADGDLLGALLGLDKSANESLSEYSGRPYALQKASAKLLKTHPEIPFLRDLRTRLSKADAVLDVVPRALDYDKKNGFRLSFTMDESRFSADNLALGVVADGGESDDERQPPGFTIGTMKAFGCWLEPQGPDEYFRVCGLRLAGLPTALGERLERELDNHEPKDEKTGASIRIRVRWHGLPRTTRAKTLLIRGIGYDTRRVYVPPGPRVEFVDPNGKLLWSTR